MAPANTFPLGFWILVFSPLLTFLNYLHDFYCCVCSVTQSCPTLYDLMDCNPPGSSVLGILQARMLEWVAISSSKESSQPRDWNCVSCISCIGRQILYHWATWEAQVYTTEYPVNFYVKRFTLFFFNLSIFIYKEMKLHIKKIIVTWHKKKLAVQRNSMKIKLLLGPCSV